MQYLYVIKCEQFCKIGVANDVQSRLAQLATGNPFGLEVLAVYGFENAEPVERAIHQRFANLRSSGEWFVGLSVGDLDIIRKICELLGATVSAKELPTVDEQDIEEAEVLAEPTETGKWDYAAMFADGWCMEYSNSKGKKSYWVWRKRRGNEKGYIYGGRIVDLPYPDLDDMRHFYRDKLLAPTESVGNEE